MNQKEPLRREMRRQLAGLEAGRRRANSVAIWQRVAELPEFQSARCVCGYVSIGAEVETEGLLRRLLAEGRQVCLPAWRAGSGYVAVRVGDFDRDLVAGRFGIPEPRGDEVCRQPEVWLVPGLAFDRAGRRLGRGGGHYDAMLREARGVRIGVAHDFQVVEAVPVTGGDVGMEYVVTNSEVIQCGRNHGFATMGD